MKTHWRYFLAIEADLVNTTRFVELSPQNFGTHSIEFARLLLSAAAEVDVVCKALCARVAPLEAASNIEHYRQVLTATYPKFPSVTAIVPFYGLTLTPWEAWTGSENPAWWRNHNKVKHDRLHHFREANLENTLNCITGLFCLLLYFYQTELYAGDLQPFPKLLDYEKFPGYLLVNPGVELPDFPR